MSQNNEQPSIAFPSQPERRPEPQRPPWEARPSWRSRWIEPKPPVPTPYLAFYRLVFHNDSPSRVRLRVSADERYALWLDGAFVGRGSERGDRAHWYYETYDVELTAGEHVLVAHAWALGRFAPWAQVSVRPGLIVSPVEMEWEDRIGTGIAAWEVFVARGVAFQSPKERTGHNLGVGPEFVIDGNEYPWEQASGVGEGWQPAAIGEEAFERFSLYATKSVPVLWPRTLPPMKEELWSGETQVRHLDDVDGSGTTAAPFDPSQHRESEAAEWDRLLLSDGIATVTILPHTTRRVVVDLADYVCFYPDLAVENGAGAEIRLTYAEAPLGVDGQKHDRNLLQGQYFRDITDTFRPDGQRRAMPTLWWRAGRYVQVCVRTAEHPLVLHRLAMVETRYPFTSEGSFDAGDGRWNQLLRVCERSLLASSHETYMDAPAYEQLSYIGDSLVEMLLTYVTSRDERLPLKTLRSFDHSRANPSGLTTSAYPSGAGQLIPPFSLLWVWAIHNHLLWRGGAETVRELLPGVRSVLDQFLIRVGEDGLLRSPAGWNWVDHSFPNWTPPGGEEGGVSGPLNWQLLLALDQAALLETAVGEPEMAQRWKRRATELMQAMDRAFWDERRGVYADLSNRAHDEGGNVFSIHSQAFAILSGRVDAERLERIAAQVSAPDVPMIEPTIYFHHYLFEAAHRVRRADWIIDRLPKWFELLDRGMKTTPENFEPGARSDCHGYGASPLFHFAATLLGIRPSTAGFDGVRITPLWRPDRKVSACVPHPRGGEVTVRLSPVAAGTEIEVELPDGVTGELEVSDLSRPLRPGRQTFVWPEPPR
jgi:hypothetical protein